jgi:predicted DCC family thiol-disulfide oxidoreductase YuxK
MQTLAVYFDSECGFCQWSRRLFQRWDGEHRLTFIDFCECAAVSNAPSEMAGAMHVLDPQGNWFAGYDAFLRISKALPKLRWLSPVLAFRPVRWMGSRIYKLIARNRYGISSLLFRVAAVPRPCGVTCDATKLLARNGVQHGSAVSGQSPLRFSRRLV